MAFTQTPLPESSRKSPAFCSRDSSSARTVVLIFIFVMARPRSSVLYCDFRLFHNVFRFWPKDNFKKRRNSVSFTANFSSRSDIVSRTTEEKTFGGGENAPGGKVNNFSTFA